MNTANTVQVMPLVSIITVCLNSQEHLEKTIKSVISQTYQNIEYIIVDGGSTDGTLGIIKRYEDHITRWISEPDRGLYDAMNKGISMSGGKLVGIINSDDFYQPEAVELIIREFLQDKDAGVFCGEVLFLWDDPRDRLQWQRRTARLGTLHQEIVHPGMFVKQEIYQKFRYDLKYKLEADVDFVYNLYFKGVKFHLCPCLIATFRVGGTSKSFRAITDRFMIRHKYFGVKSLPQNIIVFFIRSVGWVVKKYIFKGNFNHPVLRWYRRIFNKIPANDYVRGNR